MEEDLLGTGGGIARARPLFRPGPLLVVNGKVVADLSLEAVIAAHRAAPGGTLATMVLRPDASGGQFAPVTVDEVGRVVGLRGRRGQVTAFGKTVNHMFTGVHVLEPRLLDRLPLGVSDVIADAYQPALEDGGRVQSMLMTGYFEEHSTPERYLAGNLALLRRPGLVSCTPGPADRRRSRPRRSTAAPACARRCASAPARSSRPGRWSGPRRWSAPARASPPTRACAASVVWDGARAEGDLDGVVVTPEGQRGL